MTPIAILKKVNALAQRGDIEGIKTLTWAYRDRTKNRPDAGEVVTMVINALGLEDWRTYYTSRMVRFRDGKQIAALLLRGMGRGHSEISAAITGREVSHTASSHWLACAGMRMLDEPQFASLAAGVARQAMLKFGLDGIDIFKGAK
jgi:hypothetical protein